MSSTELIPASGEHAMILTEHDDSLTIHIGDTGRSIASNLRGWSIRAEGGEWEGNVLIGGRDVLTDTEGREYDWTSHQSRSTPLGNMSIGYITPR